MCITFINSYKDVDEMNVTLKNNKFTAVVTTHGAELIDFKDANGVSYIWSGDPAYWSGRNPLLFPIVGNLKDGKIRMDNHKQFRRSYCNNFRQCIRARR
jgi:galactose mutarotase-like enzyme